MLNKRLVWNFEFSTKKNLHCANLKKMEQDNLKWEARFFWPEHETICLYTFNDSLLDIANYKRKHKEDYYYLLPDSNDNIKRRRNELLYKPILKQSTNALGFGAKINLEQIQESADQEPAHILSLQNILREAQERGTVVQVIKDSFHYKFPTNPTIKLELARLIVHNQVHFSLCLEGRSLYLVETMSGYLLEKQVSCDYVTFLKNSLRS